MKARRQISLGPQVTPQSPDGLPHFVRQLVRIELVLDWGYGPYEVANVGIFGHDRRRKGGELWWLWDPINALELVDELRRDWDLPGLPLPLEFEWSAIRSIQHIFRGPTHVGHVAQCTHKTASG